METTTRRRRSWYQRRLRIQRGLVAACFLLLLVGVCWQSFARYLQIPRLHASQFLPESFWTRGDVRGRVSYMAVARSGAHKSEGWQPRQTYPYSVIPGGVRSASELREMAARDYVVARHYAGFNYERAHLVRTSARRAVYMSYRTRNRIFWTRKKVNLPPGELLLSDGNIEARVRCGNQVSGDPKVEVADEEPTEDVLDRPVAELVPDAAMPFRSVLARPSLPGMDVQPPHGPQIFANNFYFPYVPIGVAPGLCATAAQEQWDQEHGIVDKEKRCAHHHKPPVVPEPATWVLLGSGLAAMVWRYRRLARA